MAIAATGEAHEFSSKASWTGRDRSLGGQRALGLAPFDCRGELGLFASPRLDIDRELEPPAELREREGIYSLEAAEPVVTAIDRAGCKKLSVPLP